MGAAQSDFTYTIEARGTSAPGHSSIYHHPDAKPYLTTSLPSGASTLYEIFATSSSQYGSYPFLGTRRGTTYTWQNYSTVFTQANKLGKAFRSLGLHASDLIGIYSKNRYEWSLVDLACLTQSFVSVPLYEVLQADTVLQILNEGKIKLVCTSANHINQLIEIKLNNQIELQTILVFDEVDRAEILRVEEAGLQVRGWAELMAGEYEDVCELPNEASVFTVCYTSGTTGVRKGAIISHKNLVAVIAGVVNNGILFNTTDCHLSYLPLAHMMERAIFYTLMQAGASIGFYGGDSMNIRSDLAALKPTVFVSVPRLFNRFYELIIEQFNSATGVTKILISKALNSKMDNYHSYMQLKSTLWDSLVFSKVKETLGGRVRMMLTGSAPIAGEVLTFLRIVFSCPIVEGYGQTESCAASFVTHPGDLECGHIGGPIPNLEVKLIDVPEMKYSSTDTDISGNLTPRGELCLRGPTIFCGYLSNPDEEAIDSEGWLHTGDIVVRLHNNGAFKIIDRKKNFFKLAQGEFVSPERIENAYMKSDYVSQIFVYGESFQSFLIAVVVPNEGVARKKWAVEHGCEGVSFEEICRKSEFKKSVLEDMKKQEGELYGFEKVRRIYIESKVWSTANLLTPTLKLMRFKAKMQYQGVLAELYSETEE